MITAKEDPALVAAKKLQEATVALRALPDSNYANEQKPEYKAALEREKEADFAFSTAPVTSLAGALTKLRALAKDIGEDSGPDAWCLGHVNTVAAFLEGFAGEAQAEPLIELWTERNRLLALSEAADKKSKSPDDVHQFERYDLDTKAFAIERRIANTVAESLAGLLVQARLHGDLLKDGCSWIHTPALTRNVITALERMEGAS